MAAVPNFAILVGPKSAGSNMVALIEAARSGRVPATPALVVAPDANAPARARAQDLGVPTIVLDPSEPSYATKLLQALAEHRIEWICLAGFLRLLPAAVLRAFPDRVLNIHPALLPKFGGKGMYGERVHRAVLESGDRITGCTVHLVNDEYDSGPVLLQVTCPVLPDDTPSSLAQRVAALEHEAYAKALAQAIADARIAPSA